jgi:arylsulfatase A-like enzyme
MAAAGGATDASWKLDGVNLLPFLSGKSKGAPHRQLFWRFGRQYAMREGDWKLVSMGEAPMLFNLAADIGEKNDLSHTEPERLRAMSAAWEEWNKKNIPPLWVPAAQSGQKKKKKKKA